MRVLRILVMGAGAMGTAVGGFMSQAGHAVTLVGRRAHMDAIRREGLRITGIWGEHHVTNLNTRTDVAGLSGDFDLVIIAVKSYDTADAIADVRHLVGGETLVCSYQNGLGNAETIASAIGWERTVAARVIYGVWLPQPGTADITVIANPTAVGACHPATRVPRVREIAEAMNAAGLPTVYTEHVATLLWGKVAYNCALNPLSALLDVPYGVLKETAHTRETMREVVEELYAVAGAMDVPLEPRRADEYYQLLLDKLIPPTAAHYASMREDFRLKRPTEIDALNGAICRFGGAKNIDCPTNIMLTRLIRAREHALGIKSRSAAV